MDAREDHLARLKIAEHQFRLACTVHLAVLHERQTLDVPVEWSFGKHRVSYEDFGLRPDQVPLAASALEHTAMHVLCSTIRDVIVFLFPNTRHHADPQVVAAYQIARIIRNAFAHAMIAPVWSIDTDCTDKTFEIDGVISLNTTGLNGQPMQWQHYGGPLAIFRFGRFVREVFAQDPVDPNRRKPDFPSVEYRQIGRLVFSKVDGIPADAELVHLKPGDTIDFGDGYVFQFGETPDRA